MNDDTATNGHGRKPDAFDVPPDPVARPLARQPAAIEADDAILADSDPFEREAMALEAGEPLDGQEEGAASRPPRRLSLSGIALSAIALLLALAIGLWFDQLVRDLFARIPALGWSAITLGAIAALALVAIVVRESRALWKMSAIQSLKQDVAAAANERNARQARVAVDALIALLSKRPETARGRAALSELRGEVVDGPALIELAETELMRPLDARARRLVLDTAKRVSIVTAVSPRAFIDLAYVLYEAMRLIRAMAELYGGRPGGIGLIRLARDVAGHLAVTGSIAAGDSLIQQFLGHGVAARVSTRLGEGVINGMMTARIGLAAMDLCRPMPFSALKRPGVSDIMTSLMQSEKTLAERPD